jgi:hypothetical protein
MLKSMRTTAPLAFLILLASATLAVAQAPAAPPASPAPPAVPIEWMGNLVNMQGGGTTFLTVRAYGFTPQAVVDALMDMLKTKGQTAVVNELNAMPAIGYLQVTQSLAYYVSIMRYIPTPTGYRIVAACARQIGFVGMARQGIVTTDYPIGVVILDINKEGKSTGQVLPAVKLQFDKEGKFDPETYGTEPLKILNVREQKVK